MESSVRPERVLAGRYRLLAQLGQGGMGTVWLAHDELLDRQVGVKEIRFPPGVSEHEQALLRERILREARIAGRLRHPNIVAVHDVVEDGDRPWIVMELGPPRSLQSIIERSGPLTPPQAARIGRQILAALRAIHAIGIMHRDVKPDNVLIDTDGRAVLADFGIAHAHDSPVLTASGVVLGSPSYIAPERARGERGERPADLWSLGAMLYTAVEGRPPYDRPGALETAVAVTREAPDPPRRAGPLWPVISGLLRRDPGQRLEAAAADQMLRRVIEADETRRTGPMPVAAAPDGLARRAEPHPEPPSDRLGRAEQTLAFDPLVTQRIASLPAAAERAAPAAERAAPAAERAAPAAERAARAAERAAPAAERAAPAADPLPEAEPGAPAAAPLAARLVSWESASGHAGRGTFPRRGTWVITGLAAALVLAGGLVARTGLAGQAAGAARGTAPTARTGALPGFHAYADPTGLSIAVPDGWSVSRHGSDVDIRDPSKARLLVISQTGHPRPGQLLGWRRQEVSRLRTRRGYRRILLAVIRYPRAVRAVDWEFTYDGPRGPIRVINLDVLANSGHAYALFWSTPAGEWKSSLRFFRIFARTFRPAPAAGQRGSGTR